MSPDNTARAKERRKSIPKSFGDAISRGLVSVLCGYLAAMCRLFARYTGEHKAAKAKQPGQHPTANRR